MIQRTNTTVAIPANEAHPAAAHPHTTTSANAFIDDMVKSETTEIFSTSTYALRTCPNSRSRLPFKKAASVSNPPGDIADSVLEFRTRWNLRTYSTFSSFASSLWAKSRFP